MYCISLYLNILCAVFVQRHSAKITTNFSDDVHVLIVLHAYHFKFTINASIVNIPVEATFSMSILYPNRHGQYFNSWSVAAFTVS